MRMYILITFQVLLMHSSFAETMPVFQCPENLPSEEARHAANLEFINWALKNYKNLSPDKFVDLRMDSLEKNNCMQTLANIRAQPRSAHSRFSCVDKDNSHYYSKEPKANCVFHTLEAQWENLLVSHTVIVDYIPSKIVKDKDGSKKIWLKFYFANIRQAVEGSWSYDQVKSLNRYYCNQRQTVLIQGTYTLNGKVVHERRADVSILEEIEPNTINDTILDTICKSSDK